MSGYMAKQQKLPKQCQVGKTLKDSGDQFIDDMRKEATENRVVHNICFDLTAYTRNCSSSEYCTMKSRELQQHYEILQQQQGKPARQKA